MQRNIDENPKNHSNFFFSKSYASTTVFLDIEGSALHTLNSVVFMFSDGYNICE